MLETILDWTSNLVANLLDAFVSFVMNLLDLDMTVITDNFPVLVEAYNVFQAVAIGLVLAIGVLAVAKFFMGREDGATESPVAVLFRAAIAAALIYVGGYVLEWIVVLARDALDTLISLDATVNESYHFGAAEMVASAAVGTLTMGLSLVIESVVGIAIGIIMAIIIAVKIWRFIKEVLQRFVVVGILLYASPQAFSTITSKDTMEIFKKYMNMFISQCLLMALSVWSLKIIISGFTYTGDTISVIGTNAVRNSYIFRWLLTVAMCEVLTRLDTYLRQLGLNNVSTFVSPRGGWIGNTISHAAGNLVSGLITGRYSGGRTKGSSSNMLGSEAQKAASQGGVLNSGFIGAFRKGLDSYRSGRSFTESVGDARKAYKDNPYYSGQARDKKAQAMDAQRAENSQKNAAERDKRYGTTMAGFKSHMQSPVGTGTAFKNKATGEVELDGAAKASRLNFAQANDGTTVITGTGDNVTDHVRANASNASTIGSDYSKVLENTVRNGSPMMADDFLFNPANTQIDCDDVASAALEKALPGDFANDRAGGFVNVAAWTDRDSISEYGSTQYTHSGARHVEAEFMDSDGVKQKMELLDATGYANLQQHEQGDYRAMQMPSGATVYGKITPSDGTYRPADAVADSASVYTVRRPIEPEPNNNSGNRNGGNHNGGNHNGDSHNGGNNKGGNNKGGNNKGGNNKGGNKT